MQQFDEGDIIVASSTGCSKTGRTTMFDYLHWSLPEIVLILVPVCEQSHGVAVWGHRVRCSTSIISGSSLRVQQVVSRASTRGVFCLRSRRILTPLCKSGESFVYKCEAFRPVSCSSCCSTDINALTTFGMAAYFP